MSPVKVMDLNRLRSAIRQRNHPQKAILATPDTFLAIKKRNNDNLNPILIKILYE